MKATVEISLYPLTEKYEQVVIDFILQLKENSALTVETNGLSTQIFGDYNEVMKILNSKMKDFLEQHHAVFVLKVAKGELKKEDLPEALK